MNSPEEPVATKLQYKSSTLTVCLALALLAGLLGGLLGLGGGMIMGPLLLELGVQPQVLKLDSHSLTISICVST